MTPSTSRSGPSATVAQNRRRPAGSIITRKVRRRESWVGVLLAVAFGTACVGGVTWTAAVQIENAAAAEALAAYEAEKDRRSAAVLFVPMKGNVCRRRVIDNETWLIIDAGQTTCDEAVTWNSNYPEVQVMFAERLAQMRTGFRAAHK